MGGGKPSSRNVNVARATTEGKRVLKQTKDWQRTKEHLFYWIKVNMSVSRTTVADYLDDVYGRLSADPEVKEYLV